MAKSGTLEPARKGIRGVSTKRGAQLADSMRSDVLRVKPSSEVLFGTNISRASEYNQRVTLHAIRTHEGVTRQELGDLIGLTGPTIANITNRLVDLGLVQKGGRLVGGRGHPASKFFLNGDGAYSIGLEIARDHINFVVLDFAGDQRAAAAIDIPFANPLQVQSFFRSQISELQRSQVIDFKRLIGIGVGMPDDLGRTVLPDAPDSYETWSSTDIAPLLQSVVNLPIYVENDAAAAAIGEMQFGHGLKKKTFIYILLGPGLGGGIVINGEYYRGVHGRSGEIGYLPLLIDSDAISKGALDKRADTLGDAVITSVLYEQLRACGNKNVYMPKDLENLNPEGQARMEAWVESISLKLTQPLLTLSSAFDPEAIFIGGRLPDFLIDRLCRLINRNLGIYSRQIPFLPTVERAALSEDSTAIGAAVLCFNDQFLPQRNVLHRS